MGADFESTSGGQRTKDRIAVVVVSCDAYADLWPAFFIFFQTFWPDCPFKIYLVANRREAEFPKVTSLLTGEDRSWSGNLKTALNNIEEEYVLVFVEDLLFRAPVNTSEVLRVAGSFLETGGNCLKFIPTIPPDRLFNPDFGTSAPEAPYRVSAVATLWNKKTLVELLYEDENAWEFELNGTRRARDLPGFYCVYVPRFKVWNAVVKRKWRRNSLRWVKRNCNLPSRFERPVMSWTSELFYQLKSFRFWVMQRMPPSLRNSLYSRFRP